MTHNKIQLALAMLLVLFVASCLLAVFGGAVYAIYAAEMALHLKFIGWGVVGLAGIATAHLLS